MNKEVYYEGWLIKSPPTKRIWRARWRRRWFTLKQGEIPEQFCLEYYADRKCRKLKGVIDLDQCEQVDCGLRLENRKQKFQFMFDIKTPKRTYYLAADTETDMRDWVNCICQVCHLHDTNQAQDENNVENLTKLSMLNVHNSNDTTTTTINSNDTTGSGIVTVPESYNNILRRHPLTVVEQQPIFTSNRIVQQSNNDSGNAYVNTEYTNRETILCDAHFVKQQLPGSNTMETTSPSRNLASQSAVYLNASAFQESARRVAFNSIRRIPENLILHNTPLIDTSDQLNNIQPSPNISNASGPYIPISECFSGSPKFAIDSNNPTTPLNNLDPKFYDTPRSHNNIGLNLTNDQSYSPKITNCGTQQTQSNVTKNRSQRSDSDSESVFTDDDEWTHPMPLRENLERHTRPSDSSVENESFVLTYSQRFSKLPDDMYKEQIKAQDNKDPDFDKISKVLKNKNNLVLDIKQSEKSVRELPQFSDTENTSPAIIIGPRDANSVVDESYDIPRSHQLPYYNMTHLMDKVMIGIDTNPIAASTPNLNSLLENSFTSPILTAHTEQNVKGTISSVSSVRTLPRTHCYTNAAPTKIEGNVFRYDFIEQNDLPPVNRKLKPKVTTENDKSSDDLPVKPTQFTTNQVEVLNNKHQITQLQNASTQQSVAEIECTLLKPPSIDRKNKPNVYKIGTSNTLGNANRRSSGIPFSMLLPNEGDANLIESRTLPRQPRPSNYAFKDISVGQSGSNIGPITFTANSFTIHHQRTISANAAIPLTLTAHPSNPSTTVTTSVISTTVSGITTTSVATLTSSVGTNHLGLIQKNEHKLQYFDLDVANAPPIHRQSMSVGNLSVFPGVNRLGLATETLSRAPIQSSVVYNSVDFVKTEAFKRIREERKKENEGINNNNNNNSNCNK